MQNHRLTGPGAGVEKYDLITALAVKGLVAGGALQTSMMRLIALLTARYNWTGDEVTIGQREMAALWAVDERTAKRETKRLIDLGLIEIKRAGVKGRVAAYRFKRDSLYSQSQGQWGNVGPDFDARMSARHRPEKVETEQKIVHVDFPKRKAVSAPVTRSWQKVLAHLSAEYPQHFDAWFSQLAAEAPDSEGLLVITAPSKFVASYVSGRYLAQIEAAVLAAYQRPLRCLFQTKG